MRARYDPPVRMPARRVSVLQITLAAACLALFLVLAAAVSRPGEVGFDEPVIGFVTGLGISLDSWGAVTELGGRVLVPVGAGLVLWLLWQRRFADAVIVAVALVGASLFTDAAKELIARPRPPGAQSGPAAGYAFPSGHTLNSTVTYGLVALYASRSHMAPAARRVAIAILLAIPLLVGLSRIALGVHYPSDVLGGWLAGMAVVFTVAAITGPAPTRATSASATATPGDEAARPGP